MITPWSSYTYLRLKEYKGLTITQMVELFNKLLPFPVKQESMFLEDVTTDKSVFSSNNQEKPSLLNRFQTYLASFNTWYASIGTVDDR